MLLKHFLNTPKDERERAGFRLPAMVPIIFYNGQESWTAVKSLKEYQNCGDLFGDHVLNLKYYLIDLSKLEEKYILSTNTVLDNIMYCDKFRKRAELTEAIRTAYQRMESLGAQEKEEFHNWVKCILLSVCGNRETVMEEILSWTENGEYDMAFKYNIIRMFEEERAEGEAIGEARGRAEAVLDLLTEKGPVPEGLREEISAQRDLSILRQWLKLAARVRTTDEFQDRMQSVDTDS